MAVSESSSIPAMVNELAFLLSETEGFPVFPGIPNIVSTPGLEVGESSTLSGTLNKLTDVLGFRGLVSRLSGSTKTGLVRDACELPVSWDVTGLSSSKPSSNF